MITPFASLEIPQSCSVAKLLVSDGETIRRFVDAIVTYKVLSCDSVEVLDNINSHVLDNVELASRSFPEIFSLEGDYYIT